MKRVIISLFLGGFGGVALGFALGIFIYPFWFLNDIASESLAADIQRTNILARGGLSPGLLISMAGSLSDSAIAAMY